MATFTIPSQIIVAGEEAGQPGGQALANEQILSVASAAAALSSPRVQTVDQYRSALETYDENGTKVAAIWLPDAVDFPALNNAEIIVQSPTSPITGAYVQKKASGDVAVTNLDTGNMAQVGPFGATPIDYDPVNNPGGDLATVRFDLAAPTPVGAFALWFENQPIVGKVQIETNTKVLHGTYNDYDWTQGPEIVISKVGGTFITDGIEPGDEVVITSGSPQTPQQNGIDSKRFLVVGVDGEDSMRVTGTIDGNFSGGVGNVPEFTVERNYHSGTLADPSLVFDFYDNPTIINGNTAPFIDFSPVRQGAKASIASDVVLPAGTYHLVWLADALQGFPTILMTDIANWGLGYSSDQILGQDLLTPLLSAGNDMDISRWRTPLDPSGSLVDDTKFSSEAAAENFSMYLPAFELSSLPPAAGDTGPGAAYVAGGATIVPTIELPDTCELLLLRVRKVDAAGAAGNQLVAECYWRGATPTVNLAINGNPPAPVVLNKPFAIPAAP